MESACRITSTKVRRGADFICDMGFRTTEADAEYGPDWLDRTLPIEEFIYKSRAGQGNV